MIIRFQLQPCNCSPPLPFHHLAPLDLYTLNFSPPVASPSVFLPSLVTYFPLPPTPLFPISLCHFFLSCLLCPLFLLSSHLSFPCISSSPDYVFSPAFYCTCLLLPLFTLSYLLLSSLLFSYLLLYFLSCSPLLFHSIPSSTPPVLLSSRVCLFLNIPAVPWKRKMLLLKCQNRSALSAQSTAHRQRERGRWVEGEVDKGE